MHRVTFVSRVLPPTSTASPMQQAMLALNMSSNLALIQRLQPYLRNATANFDELSQAATTAVQANLPTLSPYISDIITILASYYDVL